MATAKQKQDMSQFIMLMERFEWDMAHAITRAGRVPDEWQTVWRKRSSKKRKVSLYVDEATYRFFKSMGAGVGPRMNTVLSAFARARVAGLVEDEGLRDKYRKEWMGQPKPSWSEEQLELHRRLGWDTGDE